MPPPRPSRLGWRGDALRAWSRVAAGTGRGHPAHPVVIRRGPGSTGGWDRRDALLRARFALGLEPLTSFRGLPAPPAGWTWSNSVPGGFGPPGAAAAPYCIVVGRDLVGPGRAAPLHTYPAHHRPGGPARSVTRAGIAAGDFLSLQWIRNLFQIFVLVRRQRVVERRATGRPDPYPQAGPRPPSVDFVPAPYRPSPPPARRAA